jgi:hypothetical protein
MEIKGAGMKIRKLAVLAAAIAIPISGLATLAAVSGGTAGASNRGGDKGTYICAVDGVPPAAASTVTFQSPGITQAGSSSENSISKTKTTVALLPSGGSCGTVNGSGGPYTISASNPTCSSSTTPPAGPHCTIDAPPALGDYAYGSWNSFIATGASTIITGLPHPKFKIDSDTFVGTTTGASSVVGAPCTSGEAGFNITGTVAANEGYSSFSLTACLGTVTAPAGSAGTMFLNDVGTTTVLTVQIDPADSTVTVS